MQNVSSTEVDGVVHRASIRNETRMLIEIETDRVGTWSLCEQAVDGGYPKGGAKHLHRQQLVIYASQWPEVQRLVRTDAHEAAWADAMASAPQQPEIVEKRRAAETALASAKNGPQRTRAEEKMLDVEHRTMREANRLLLLKPGFRDGLPPLLSARVVKADVAPPPTPQNLAQNANHDLAAVIARLIDERSPKGRQPRE